MMSENTPEEHENSEAACAPQGSDSPERPESPQPTALFVRRERRMNLGGWVVLALVIGAASGLVWGMFRGVFEFAPLVIAALYGVLFVGVGLALVAVIIDWVLERARAK
ncbi:Uncharacterised protein [Mycobacteroides abscessus subsp. abscessus]|nr:Uncharacterised protein [Mycobacteroides abscessus subsp. abscessus]